MSDTANLLRVARLMPMDPRHRQLLCDGANEIERLRDVLENIVIAYGMGWDMDGVIDVARETLGEKKDASDGDV